VVQHFLPAALGSGNGMAKVTLSYPGWKVGEVKPVTIEVPIGPMSWEGLFFNYTLRGQ
jgi:hypothetical protein